MEYRALREAYTLTDTQIKAIADDAPEETFLDDLNLPTRKGLLDMLLELLAKLNINKSGRISRLRSLKPSFINTGDLPSVSSALFSWSAPTQF